MFTLQRTDAYLWRLPTPQPTNKAENRGTVDAVEVPKLSNSMADEDDGDGGMGAGRYKYVGGLPDLQSSEVTTLSVREPLLATGLANGRIFLWR